MTTVELPAGTPSRLAVGDVVEVRSAEEILATLDENGELDSLPFMPEMLKYCGQRLTVYRSAHKLCDTITRSGIRRMDDAVHLTGVRCDGGGHGGCQAACLIYWKTAWLRPVPADAPPAGTASAAAGTPSAAGPAGGDVPAPPVPPLLTIASRRPAEQDGTELYRCQATEILRAAPQGIPARNLGQYAEDVRTGNTTVGWAVRAFLVGLYNRVQTVSANKLPRPLRWRGGKHWGDLRGTATQSTPTGHTDLRPGDLVRVKSRKQIAATLNAQLLNRGMGFDAEMARFCGRTARVARRVDRIIDERTGKMIQMRNPCIVLEDVICEGAFNAVCPRSITPYWREIWLEKVAPAREGTE